MHIEKLLEEKGLQLPQPIRLPAGMRLPFQWVGVRGNGAYVSGHGHLLPDLYCPTGRLRSPTARSAGRCPRKRPTGPRLTAPSTLASLQQEQGDLDRVVAWLRVLGMVNTVPAFTGQPAAINGFSDLILELCGPEAGQHARSALGMPDLPLGLPIEIEAEVDSRLAGRLARAACADGLSARGRYAAAMCRAWSAGR